MERLALIEVLDAHGRCQHAVRVDHWPVAVGRALDCDVVLGDPHVAAHHLFLEMATDPVGSATAPRLQLRVGTTRNGVRLGAPGFEQRIAAGGSAILAPGVLCHLGHSTLRVRLAAEPLAEELPLAPPAGRRQALQAAAAGVVLLAWLAMEQWLQNEPGAGWDKYVPSLLGAGVGVVLWSAALGRGSKIFQGHFRVLPHLRVVLGFLLASMAADLLLLLAAFALSLPVLSHIRGWVEIGMLAALLAGHCGVLLPGHERTVRRVFATLCVVVLGIDGALTWRHHQRLFDEQFAAALPPPAVRLVSPQPIGALLSDVRATRDTLEKRAKDDEESDTNLPED